MTATVENGNGAAPAALTKKDFASGVDPRWCPGCGDYSILNQVQKLLPSVGVPRANIVFFSGIGCSSRFPYYMNNYGMHTLHGRAPSFASGLKISRPELQVWIVTGDGDALAIGGNHFIHTMRRNLDVKILLFNNRIYGLTKGQASPTSELGKVTKSTPEGSPDYPFNPAALALGAGATFVGRTMDSDGVHLGAVLAAAAAHKGTAFVEVLQNCPVFNDGAHRNVTEKAVRDVAQVRMEHGKPLLFAKGTRGIRMDGRTAKLELVEVGAGKTSPEDILVHDAGRDDPTLAFMLAQLAADPTSPSPMGVFRDVRRPTVDELTWQQIDTARSGARELSLRELLAGKDHWTVA